MSIPLPSLNGFCRVYSKDPTPLYAELVNSSLDSAFLARRAAHLLLRLVAAPDVLQECMPLLGAAPYYATASSSGSAR